MTVLPLWMTRYRGLRLLVVLTAVGVLLPQPRSTRASLRIVPGAGGAERTATLLGTESILPPDLAQAHDVALPVGPRAESSSEPVPIQEGSWQGLTSHRRGGVSLRRFVRDGVSLRPVVESPSVEGSASRVPPLARTAALPVLPVLLCRWTC